MRHNIALEGIRYRLRPIEDADAAFVVELRSNPALNAYLHRSSSSLADQLEWFSAYYRREGDYYFVIEDGHTGAREGVIAIYDIDADTRCGEWGRWILRPDSLAAVESAWLIYTAAFEKLGLDRLYCRTVAENTRVVSFHDSCGIEQRRLLEKHFHIDGRELDAVEHCVDRENRAQIQSKLERLANFTARRAHA